MGELCTALLEIEVASLRKTIRVIRVLCIVLCLVSLGVAVVASRQYRARIDTRGPDITMDSPTVTVSIHDDPSAMLEGVVSTDRNGEDVSDLLMVESLGNFITPGTREAKIVAFDQNGNASKTVRTVVYSDYTAPRISLSGPLSVPSNRVDSLLSRITVTDCLDGDISNHVLLSSKSGELEYLGVSEESKDVEMLLQVSNSAGDSLSYPVTLEFYAPAQERLRPKIQLSDYLIYRKVGDKAVDPEDFLLSLTLDSKEYTYDAGNKSFVPKGTTYAQLEEQGQQAQILPLRTVRITNPADMNTPGAYEITYRCTGKNNAVATVRLIVIVEE